MVFEGEREYGLTKKQYLNTARRYAKNAGYDPNLLNFATNSEKKLSYNGVQFGSAKNLDFILYRHLEKNNLIGDNEAQDHRRRYLARATKIKGNWMKNPLSKNNLAIKILWAGY